MISVHLMEGLETETQMQSHIELWALTLERSLSLTMMVKYIILTLNIRNRKKISLKGLIDTHY